MPHSSWSDQESAEHAVNTEKRTAGNPCLRHTSTNHSLALFTCKDLVYKNSTHCYFPVSNIFSFFQSCFPPYIPVLFFYSLYFCFNPVLCSVPVLFSTFKFYLFYNIILTFFLFQVKAETRSSILLARSRPQEHGLRL